MGSGSTSSLSSWLLVLNTSMIGGVELKYGRSIGACEVGRMVHVRVSVYGKWNVVNGRFWQQNKVGRID